MEFEIGFCDQLGVKDSEITELLHTVYVEAAYTSVESAETLFQPSSVRARGTMLVARECANSHFSGMVIVVPPNSPAKVMAGVNECEMHLLGVKPEYRGLKLGTQLVDAALGHAKENQWSKMLLWTQENMINAQKLYRSCGFEETGEMHNNGTNFIIYEKTLT